jgi:hypothetical protein
MRLALLPGLVGPGGGVSGRHDKRGDDCLRYGVPLTTNRLRRREAPLTSTPPQLPVNGDVFPIKERLAAYPSLQHALGDPWAKRQESVHPAKSPYALARWLRIDGYEPRLEMLERLLTTFKMAPSMGERRNRIRTDPKALIDTVVELHFAAWLTQNNIRFEMTKIGADFRVELADSAILPIEATTPRHAMWFDDLFTRFTYIKRTSGLSARWGFYAEDVPVREADEDLPHGVAITARIDDFLPDNTAESILDAIVDETLMGIADLQSPASTRRPSFTLACPEVGLRAEWWNDGSGYLSGASGARTPLVWGPWAEVRDAARYKVEKSKQLPSGQTSALLVGTNQLDNGDLRYWADWVEREPDQWAPIKWADIPGHIKYVVLYKVSWELLEPQCALLLINTESSYPDVPGFEAFRERMFPFPYRKVPTRHVVWASTERCFDPSRF